MMLMRKVDRATGLWKEDVVVDVRPLPEEIEEDTLLIAIPCPDGFCHPRWDADREVWEEGATQEEIDALYTPPKRPPDTEALLQAQVQALSDRNEFLEDCIAEMASVVYGDA